MSRELLVIIDGPRISRNYYRYKYLIKQKFSPQQIRPYVLQYTDLAIEDKKYISDLLDKSKTKYEWFTTENIN